MLFSSLIAPVFALLGMVSGNSLAGRAAQLTQVQNFGDNPSGTGMYIYVPQKLAAKPAVIVAIHFCTGTAQAYYQQSPYSKLADQKGFIVIYPSSPHVSLQPHVLLQGCIQVRRLSLGLYIGPDTLKNDFPSKRSPKLESCL